MPDLPSRLNTVVVEPWGRIDSQQKSPRCGRVSARTATMVTAYTSALMLVYLNFVAMSRQVQHATVDAFVDLVARVDPAMASGLWPYEPLMLNLAWVAHCAVSNLLVPALVARFVLGLSLTDCGMRPVAYGKHFPVYALLFLPVGVSVWIISESPAFLASYPFYKHPIGWPDLLVWELGYAVQFFTLEFFYRGFMLRGFAAELGSRAVLVMMIPYCMIHFGKPLPECLGSIIAGTVLGVLALDTRSIWGGVTIHVAVAWMMDLMAVYHKQLL